MEADGPSLDFPAERVWDLLDELCRILLNQLLIIWRVSRKSLENYRRLLTLRTVGWWSKGEEFAREHIGLFLSNIPSKSNLSTLGSFLEDAIFSFRSCPLWIQVVIVCVWIFVARRFQAALSRKLERRHRRRRRTLSMKTGRSEIVQGRTSLIYGAAGDLMDEEYLQDAGAESELGGRRRFGTFDFFGINTANRFRVIE